MGLVTLTSLAIAFGTAELCLTLSKPFGFGLMLSTFVCYLMPNPSFKKNSNGAI